MPVEGARGPRFASGWWKELKTLEDGVGEGWFTNNVVRKVSNGRGTSFWNDRWIGGQPLALAFPWIFSILNQKEAKVRDLWSVLDGDVSWNLLRRIQPFLWEMNLIGDLLARIDRVVLGGEADRWVWLPEEGGAYSVRSSYRVLEDFLLLDEGLSALEEEVFANLRKSPTLSKVVAFSWMAILDRIPTRSNLVFWGVIPPGEQSNCVLCGVGEETTSHLFLHCEVASLIWRKVLNWLGINVITPQHLLFHFACWCGEVNSRHL